MLTTRNISSLPVVDRQGKALSKSTGAAHPEPGGSAERHRTGQPERGQAILKDFGYGERRLTTKQETAATNAEQGIVSIHAHTIVPATPQRTALNLLIEPTPIIAPVMVWVVLMGTPRAEAA